MMKRLKMKGHSQRKIKIKRRTRKIRLNMIKRLRSQRKSRLQLRFKATLGDLSAKRNMSR